MNTAAIELLKSLCADKRVERIAQALGVDAELHLVGGCVRDSLRNLPNADIDLASKLLPQTVAERLETHGIKTVPTGLKHQTIVAIPIAGEREIEITTFRGAGMSPESGVVSSENIETDLAFRDFTINAIAFSVLAKELIDPFSGQADIESKRLRAVLNPVERFSEDPLRVLRLVRFAAQTAFNIDPETASAATQFATQLAEVSVERIREEFSRLLTSAHPDRGLELLRQLGLLSAVIPELEATVNFEQNIFHKTDVFVHTQHVVLGVPPELRLRLAALLHDIGKPATLSVDAETGDRHFYKHESVGEQIAREALKRLRYPNQIIDDVCCLVRTHMRPLMAGTGGLRRILRDTGELYTDWRKLKESDAKACKYGEEQFDEEMKAFDQAIEKILAEPAVHPLKNLALNGNDLIAYGIAKGPQIGELLRALHERVLDDPTLNQRERLLELLNEIVITDEKSA